MRCSTESPQLTILTQAVHDHCLAYDIYDESSRDQIAYLVMSLFSGGARSAEEFKAGLYGVSDRSERPRYLS
jgi:hypothetical protein